MKKALRNFILSDSAITAIISTRCYSFPAPQGADMPYLMLQRIVENPGRNLVGTDERYREIWQIDSYASTDQAAEELKNAVRSKCDVCAPFTMGDFTIYNMFLDSSNDLSELELDGGQVGIYRKQMDFVVIRRKTKN